MSKLKRHKVNKSKSRKKFVSNTVHTKAANLRANPMRGGFRL